MNSVIAHLRHDGFEIDDFIPDRAIHRFKDSPGDRKKSGWYVGFQNFSPDNQEQFYVVVYGTWRDNEAKTFCTLNRKLTAHEKKVVESTIAQGKCAAESEISAKHEETARASAIKWEKLSLDGKSEYLARKQIDDCPGLGVRFDNFNGAFYVPVRDIDGKLWSLQCIDWRGDKLFEKGGRVGGCFHIIGDLGDEPSAIYFAEGFSTAASISKCIGAPVVVTHGKGKLRDVGMAMRLKYPEADLFFCADVDADGGGLASAEEAASAVAGVVIAPAFKARSEGDFNDLHCEESADEVRRQILGGSKPVPQEAKTAITVLHLAYPDEDVRTQRKKGTMANVAEMLRRLGVVVRFNVISKEEEILIPGLGYSQANRDNATLAWILDWCVRVGIPETHLGSYLTAMADQNLYNPVANWIESRPWDGTSRLGDLYATVTAVGEGENLEVLAMKEKLMRAWMISAVAAVFSPEGVSAHGVLVFQGPQNMGKTAWFKRLAPSHLNVIADGLSLYPNDKDSVLGAISKWLVELGELDHTFRKNDIAQLKAFITRDKDTLRRPYAKRDSHYERRTVFFGSVNEDCFLRDTTGNRRFWTIACESIDYRHSVDMQQVWAEVKARFDGGERWVLSSEEIAGLSAHNESFEEISPVHERIESCFDWSLTTRVNGMTTTEVCQAIGIDNPTRADVQAAGQSLRKLTDGQRVVIRRGVYGYRLPPKRKSSF